MAEWFEEWFGEEYLQLYPHRDDADAERVVGLIRRTLPWRDGWRTLDVACGAGRHARALELAGARPIGLDLSASLLRRAREVTDASLVRADMRWLPIRARSTDLTVNLFTSFGYFEGDDEHARALAAMVRTVRRGGWFVLDYLNASAVRARLAERHTTGAPHGAEADRRLSEDGRFVCKTIRTPDGRRFVERVRLFSPAELEAMLQRAGLAIRHRFGDYAGAPLSDGAPRTVLMGQIEESGLNAADGVSGDGADGPAR
ncbi:MAG TPA: methyltransferase domain-containing protein [Gemmatimonadales bacterium]|nr:methyltransferase domain-containing protein [Gemmatimonadales bacterium]